MEWFVLCRTVMTMNVFERKKSPYWECKRRISLVCVDKKNNYENRIKVIARYCVDIGIKCCEKSNTLNHQHSNWLLKITKKKNGNTHNRSTFIDENISLQKSFVFICFCSSVHLRFWCSVDASAPFSMQQNPQKETTTEKKDK